jgi:hypothetical protein
MANEIKKTSRTSWSKNGAEIIIATDETLDQTGEQAIESVQVIQSTSEALVFGDVSAPAHVAFKNLNKKWSQLTTGEKASYTDQADYETKNTVYVGTTNPTTSGDAQYKFIPGAGTSFVGVALAWYACKATDNVNLLVFAAEV